MLLFSEFYKSETDVQESIDNFKYSLDWDLSWVTSLRSELLGCPVSPL